ncbi:helix-turn-helix domain-containing protein [Streptomyces sp. S.PNR 29]|uniref:helix-turn-helix domain-containing protein n=1 Tax=Streptomyces sp. S.PNR 29 TaxID=2973805 RepID=UPI0025B12E6F|nr:helix-turn-helix domain-containing protein [Streptomyces sp. S.PNR 29]MDN0195302.1 helix-turn-helix domain-containing protein [Streptomyces sp. S.PNR 29]
MPGGQENGHDRPLGAELRSARLRRKVTLRELARRTHYSHTYLSKVESGHKSLTPELAKRCCDALGPDSALAALVHRAQLARRPWPRPRQLPAPPAHFIGRETELADARAWLRARHTARPGVPVLAVHGPAGIGKTALVLRWAAEHAEEFADGTLFADLGNGERRVEPAVVLRGFVQALGIEAHRIPGEPDEVAALFRSLVHGTRTLIVLDGVVDTDQVVPMLPGPGDCAVAVTSRRRLAAVQAHFDPLSIRLGRMAVEEGAELVRSLLDGTRVARALAEQIRHGCPRDIRQLVGDLLADPRKPAGNRRSEGPRPA